MVFKMNDYVLYVLFGQVFFHLGKSNIGLLILMDKLRSFI